MNCLHGLDNYGLLLLACHNGQRFAMSNLMSALLPNVPLDWILTHILGSLWLKVSKQHKLFAWTGQTMGHCYWPVATDNVSLYCNFMSALLPNIPVDWILTHLLGIVWLRVSKQHNLFAWSGEIMGHFSWPVVTGDVSIYRNFMSAPLPNVPFAECKQPGMNFLGAKVSKKHGLQKSPGGGRVSLPTWRTITIPEQ